MAKTKVVPTPPGVKVKIPHAKSSTVWTNILTDEFRDEPLFEVLSNQGYIFLWKCNGKWYGEITAHAIAARSSDDCFDKAQVLRELYADLYRNLWNAVQTIS